MGRLIYFKPKEKFEIIKIKNGKVLLFITKEEQVKKEKIIKEKELLKYILENSPNF